MKKNRTPWEKIRWERPERASTSAETPDRVSILPGEKPRTAARPGTLRAVIESVGPLSVDGAPLDEARVQLN
jgi:hypothetical protein